MKEKKTHLIEETAIPANVRYCNTIPAGARLLYSEIAFICRRDGYCTALSKYFAKLYGVKRTTISVWINSLQKKCFIKCEIKHKFIRVIFLPTADRKTRQGILKNIIPLLEKSNDNTTYYIRELSNDAHVVDDFDVQTKQWVNKDGVKCGIDSIDYEEEE